MPANHSILLVEDDRLVLATLSQGLIRAGYDLKTAESVDEAEETLSSGERPDLILLDVHMHDRSGLELAERLQSFDHIPFMLLTAYSDKEIVVKATALGALGYLVKPIDTAQLIPAIEAAISRANEFRNLRDSKDQLQVALDGEREISIAIGITMVQYRMSHKAAFGLLRKNARSQRRKLAALAAEIVKTCDALGADNAEKSS
jgi:response regulator NasT